MVSEQSFETIPVASSSFLPFQMLMLALHWPYTSPYVVAVCCLHIMSQESYPQREAVSVGQSVEEWFTLQEWTDKFVFRLLLYVSVIIEVSLYLALSAVLHEVTRVGD